MEAANNLAEVAKSEVDEAYASQMFHYYCEMIQVGSAPRCPHSAQTRQEALTVTQMSYRPVSFGAVH